MSANLWTEKLRSGSKKVKWERIKSLDQAQLKVQREQGGLEKD